MSEPEVWEQVLEQEQQAVYGFGLVGGRLGPENVLARQSLDTHRERVAQCQTILRGLGVDPVPGPVAFTPDLPVTTDQRARQLATELEQSCAGAYSSLTAETRSGARRLGTQWLRESAIDQFRWSGQLPSLPGLGA